MSAKQVALVTGAERGIGRATALALAKAGWSVAVAYHGDTQAATATVEAIWSTGGGAIPVPADLSQPAGREQLIERVLSEYGRVDLLVNAADAAPRERADLLDMSESAYDAMLEANLKAPFFLTQRVARTMLDLLAQGRIHAPRIVTIGSMNAYTSSPTQGAYCLAKAGLGMMTRLFADRLAAQGIAVYELRPGIIESELNPSARATYAALISDGLTPVPRLGQPEDVAKAVVALAAGALPFSTGEVINIDGGFHLHRL